VEVFLSDMIVDFLFVFGFARCFFEEAEVEVEVLFRC
jgi:hypothetical protein